MTAGEEDGQIQFYRVYRVRPEERDNLYPHAILMNCGLPRNGLHPVRMLRDYLVQPDPDNPDLYLGKSYFAVGPLRLAPTFFLLERYKRIEGEVGFQLD